MAKPLWFDTNELLVVIREFKKVLCWKVFVAQNLAVATSRSAQFNHLQLNFSAPLGNASAAVVSQGTDHLQIMLWNLDCRGLVPNYAVFYMLKFLSFPTVAIEFCIPCKHHVSTCHNLSPANRNCFLIMRVIWLWSSHCMTRK